VQTCLCHSLGRDNIRICLLGLVWLCVLQVLGDFSDIFVSQVAWWVRRPASRQ
jgi:hypothetical protein